MSYNQHRPPQEIFTERIRRIQVNLVKAVATQGLTMTEAEREAVPGEPLRDRGEERDEP